MPENSVINPENIRAFGDQVVRIGWPILALAALWILAWAYRGRKKGGGS